MWRMNLALKSEGDTELESTIWWGMILVVLLSIEIITVFIWKGYRVYGHFQDIEWFSVKDLLRF